MFKKRKGGIVIKLEPNDQLLDFEERFDQQDKKGKVLKTLYLMYKGQFRLIFTSFFFFLIKHSPVWIMPIVTANMINIASDPQANSLTGLWINGAIISIVILQNIPTHLLHVRFLSKASRQIEAALRSTLMRKLQHLSISYHNELQSGIMQTKILRDVENIEVLSKQIMMSFSTAFVNVIVAISITAFRNSTVALFFVGVIPISILLLYLFRGKMQEKNNDFRIQIESMSNQVAETVSMIPVTRAHGLEDLEIKKTDHTLQKLKDKGFRLDSYEALFGASSWVVFSIFQVICLLFSVFMAYNEKIPIGDVVLYQSYFSQILMSVNQLITVYPQLAKGYESIVSVSEVLFSKENAEYKGQTKLKAIKGAFTFDEVTFRYKASDKKVLDKFSLYVKPGEIVALVGESGAGKSTVLSMLIGFYRPDEGELLLDGASFDDLDMKNYRQQIAVVPQDTLLFSGTIKENITYGLNYVSEDELQKVIQMANLQDVIMRMPEGLDTRIGEHGGRLSGGQRQRIAIARAMIRQPEVILLDEATSALDNISEYKVQEALSELIKGRTTFIVAHRLSTIRNADRIVVMKEGQCVEEGTYQELMERKGEFYQLKRMQT